MVILRRQIVRQLRLGLLLVLALGGCTSLHARTEAPGTVAPRDFPHWVRLQLRDGSRVELFQARIVGDTIHGSLANTTAAAVPAAEGVSWEGSGVSGGKTLAVIGLAGTVILALYFAFARGVIID